MKKSMFIILLITFFISGCSALIYQLVWQRYLFTSLGVDVDSVTIIVSAFMLGIGIGGATGGYLADRHPKLKMQFYGAAEFLLACIGGASPFLFSMFLNSNLANSYWLASIALILALLVPTTIMGATLPILTVYFNDHLKNIGGSVGVLYFSNTLGAATGVWMVSHFLFPNFGLNFSALAASLGNLVCCALIFISISFKGRM